MLLQADASESGLIKNILLGALGGIVTAWATCCALYQISQMAVIAILLGFLLCAGGGMIMYRVITLNLGAGMRLARFLVLALTTVSIVCGPLAGALYKGWAPDSKATTIPMYVLVAISLAHVLCYNVTTMVVHGVFHLIWLMGPRNETCVRSLNQKSACYLVEFSFLVGLVCGISFGALGVSGFGGCLGASLPISALFGAVFGALNHGSLHDPFQTGLFDQGSD